MENFNSIKDVIVKIRISFDSVWTNALFFLNLDQPRFAFKVSAKAVILDEPIPCDEDEHAMLADSHSLRILLLCFRKS